MSTVYKSLNLGVWQLQRWLRFFLKNDENLQSYLCFIRAVCLVQTRRLSLGSVRGIQGSSWLSPIPSNSILQMGSHTYAEGRPLIYSFMQIHCLFPNPMNESKLQVPRRFIKSYVATISSTFHECFLNTDLLRIGFLFA